MNKNGFRFSPKSKYFNFNYSLILIFVYKTQEIYNFYFILKNHFTVSFQIYLKSIAFYDTMKNISMARRNDASINLLSNKKWTVCINNGMTGDKRYITGSTG